jgi:hypothetical protein
MQAAEEVIHARVARERARGERTRKERPSGHGQGRSHAQ